MEALVFKVMEAWNEEDACCMGALLLAGDLDRTCHTLVFSQSIQ